MSTERNNQLIEQVVTRFDQDMDGSMEPEESGEWVRFECIEKLIELIRSDEREACAKVVEYKWKVFEELKAAHYRQTSEPFDPLRYHKDLEAIFMSRDLAAAIRERGNE